MDEFEIPGEEFAFIIEDEFILPTNREDKWE